ncbi:MAG: hypothetical protein FWD68_05925 [Alphaproteobacteria bacterium]|nr:hypothetical protein [Alphaproteobacteria bacterium]
MVSDRVTPILRDSYQGRFRDDANPPAKPEFRNGSSRIDSGRDRSLDDGDRRAVMAAIKLSEDNQPEKAVQSFARLFSKGALTTRDKVGYGWALHRSIEALLDVAGLGKVSPAAIEIIRQRLNTYLELGISEQGRLQSLMLRHAVGLAKDRHLRLLTLLRLWDVELFQPEDFQNSVNDDGRQESCLFEAVVQQLGREAAQAASPAELEYVLPCLEDGLRWFPNNDWLKLSVAKLFRGLDRIDEARGLARDLTRSKAGEYWSWELVGDLYDDLCIKRSCYAKALTCQVREELVTKVRVKFADLIKDDYPGEARSEIERVIEGGFHAGHHALPEVDHMAQSDWYQRTAALPSGADFYDRLKGDAEELVFSELPWTDAQLGDGFVIEGRDGRRDQWRRRIYLRARPVAMEVSVASCPDIECLPPGTAVRVQLETSTSEKWKTTVHRIEPRPDGRLDDVFAECVGIIDSVNDAKSLLHFIAARDIDAMFPLDEFPGVATVGQTVVVRAANRHARNGVRTRALAVAPASGPPPAAVAKSFSDDITVTNGMGFSSAGIFLPPGIVAAAGIADGDWVEGLAVINFDARKGSWGWKAIRAEIVPRRSRC